MTKRLDGRNGSVWHAYVFMGRTQEDIADQFGISQQRVGQIVKQVQAEMPAEALDDVKRHHLESLRMVHGMLADIAVAELPPAYSNGRPIVDEDGVIVRDAGPRMAALDRIIKVEDRLAKLLGLDAPVKADVTVNEQARQVAQDAAAQAVVRLHGGTDE